MSDKRVCRKCGCTDLDCSGCVERKGYPCRWIERDLCSACLPFPADIEEAHQRFKATCGPIAFAAMAEQSVAEVMQFFPNFPEKTHTNGKQMQQAMESAGYRFFWVGGSWPRDQRRKGVAWLQLQGPWMAPGLPAGAPLSRTHWVAYNTDMIFDPNAGDWMPRELWETNVLSEWIARTANATGTYYPRKCFVLHLPTS